MRSVSSRRDVLLVSIERLFLLFRRAAYGILDGYAASSRRPRRRRTQPLETPVLLRLREPSMYGLSGSSIVSSFLSSQSLSLVS